jgi:hypothetical protein
MCLCEFWQSPNHLATYCCADCGELIMCEDASEFHQSFKVSKGRRVIPVKNEYDTLKSEISKRNRTDSQIFCKDLFR